MVSVRFAKDIHKLPQVTYFERCALVHSDSDVDTGFHYYGAEGTDINIQDITGSSHSRIVKRLKSTKPQACFDRFMTKFEGLADMPAQGSDARGGPEAEPPQEDGWPSTVCAESEADFEAHIMEVWYTELQDEREVVEATPIVEL
eukprot:8446450-Pyramimonas_sp.AAC.1